MNRFLIISALAFALCSSGLAQQTADSPATKEDIQKYFQATHAREMMDQMADAMLKPMHQMIHEQYLKDKDKLPADFEERINKQMDEMLRGMPWDEMLNAELPAFRNISPRVISTRSSRSIHPRRDRKCCAKCRQ